MLQALRCPFFLKAMAYAAPIGGLAGLIGLGGGEFRLPVLMRVIGFDARSAIPINLATSLVTLAAALAFRGQALSLAAVTPHLPEIAGLAAGGIVGARAGARLVTRLSDQRLHLLLSGLLLALGVLLLVKAFTTDQPISAMPDAIAWRIAAGVAFGAGIGLVSSVLGVAGGELLIPLLILVFGADIKTAGTASAMIALPIVIAGLLRYRRLDALPTWRAAYRMWTAMNLGSVAGAAVGAALVVAAPAAALKFGLGLLLIYAAAKTLKPHRR
jgi:uncharacterized membrane protein YfcA